MISYLILDFNRPNESALLLDSIWRHSKFPFAVIFLSNGGTQDYAWQFYEKGLIHKLILRKENSGCGLGTKELFRSSEHEFNIYLQNDQFLVREFSRDELEHYINHLKQNPSCGHIDLAGNQGNGRPSERAFLTNRDFYNSMNVSSGGPGKKADVLWSEESVQNHYKENNIHFVSSPLLFADNGAYSIRENPDGSVWEHRTDTKQLRLVRGPVKEKFVYPKFTDGEWELVLKTQKWPKWKIPKNEAASSFVFFRIKENEEAADNGDIYDN